MIAASRGFTTLSREDVMAAEVTRREAITRLATVAAVGGLLVATSGQARAAEQVHEEAKGSDLHVEWGFAQKKQVGLLVVKFKSRFAEPPAVLLTPYYDGTGREVTHVETLVRVDDSEFELISANAAEEYSVSWVAIGRRK
jgi:hypothetical protein